MPKTFLQLVQTCFSACLFLSGIGLPCNSFAGDVLKLNVGILKTSEIERQVSRLQHSSLATEWIVQFKSHIRYSDRRGLQKSGIEIFDYIPDDALVVRTDFKTLRSYRLSHSHVATFVPFLGSFKISPEIGMTNVFNCDRREALTIHFFKAQEGPKLTGLIGEMSENVLIQEHLGRSLDLLLPRNLIPMVAAMTGVEQIQSQSSGSEHSTGEAAELLFPELGMISKSLK